MINEIFDKALLLEQAGALKKKGFRGGFDNMDADGARLWIELNYERLRADLDAERYTPMPAVGFQIAKTAGGYRKLNRLTALDSILQMSALSVLSPWNEEHFSASSFAFRTGRGTGAALRRYVELAQQYPYAAKIDVVSCYDNIDWERLEACLLSFYSEKKLVRFLMKMAKMPVLAEGELLSRDKGVLQGAPISVLLCNLYYHPLDCLLEREQIPFIRYADDLVIFSDDAARIRENYQSVLSYIEQDMRLTRNSRKCEIASPDKLRYLGYKFRRDRHGIIALEADADAAAAYYNWNESRARNTRRSFDLLSNGILRQKDFSLRFETEEGKTTIPVEATDVINVYSNVILDSGVLKTVFRAGICINVFDRENRLLGSFTPHAPLKSPKVTHSQILAYYNERERLALARDFVRASTHNALLNIRYYNKQRPDAQLQRALEEIDGLDKKVKAVRVYETLLLLEANIREAYYRCYDTFLLSDEFVFEKRSRRPPENEFNALLSFGNTVLYNLIATEINKSPLDIRVGFLHATNRRLQSLNLDLSELFKPLIVDRTILSLINRGSIHADCFFRNEDGGVFLNEEGKHLFLAAFYAKLDTQLTVDGKKMNYYQIIQEEVAKLVRYFRNEATYRAFRQVR